MQDAQHGPGDEPVAPVGQGRRPVQGVQFVAQEEELGQRPGMERQGHLGRKRRRGGASTRRGHRRPAAAGCGEGCVGQVLPGRPLVKEAQVELAQAGADVGPGRRIDLRRGEQGGHGIEVDPHSQPALRAGLERRGAAAAEGVKDDVAGSRVAGDEGMGKPRGEHREIAAHGVERVAPEALLELPLGLQGERRERDRFGDEAKRRLAKARSSRSYRRDGGRGARRWHAGRASSLRVARRVRAGRRC